MAVKSYSVAEAQVICPPCFVTHKAARWPSAVATRPLAYLVSPEEWEVHLETAELLSNPEVMRALSDAKTGRTTYTSLDSLV